MEALDLYLPQSIIYIVEKYAEEVLAYARTYAVIGTSIMNDEQHNEGEIVTYAIMSPFEYSIYERYVNGDFNGILDIDPPTPNETNIHIKKITDRKYIDAYRIIAAERFSDEFSLFEVLDNEMLYDIHIHSDWFKLQYKSFGSLLLKYKRQYIHSIIALWDSVPTAIDAYNTHYNGDSLLSWLIDLPDLKDHTILARVQCLSSIDKVGIDAIDNYIDQLTEIKTMFRADMLDMSKFNLDVITKSKVYY